MFHYDGVSVGWHDYAAGRQKRVVAGHDKGALLRVQQLAANEAEATRRAEAIFLERRRGMQTLTCRLLGAPQAIAEGPLDLTGFADGCNGRWIAKAVVHKIDGRGFVTAIKAERPDDHVYTDSQLPPRYDDCAKAEDGMAPSQNQHGVWGDVYHLEVGRHFDIDQIAGLKHVRKAELEVNRLLSLGKTAKALQKPYGTYLPNPAETYDIGSVVYDPRYLKDRKGRKLFGNNTGRYGHFHTGDITIFAYGADCEETAIKTYAHEIWHFNPVPLADKEAEEDLANQYGEAVYRMVKGATTYTGPKPPWIALEEQEAEA